MIDNLLIFPIIIQLFVAITTLFLWKNINAQRIVSVFGGVLALIASVLLFVKVYNQGILIMNAANWEAPFGIVFVADLFSSTMVLLACISGLSVSIFSTIAISKQRLQFGYIPIYHFLVMGLCGAFLTGDIFNLYVWFEVIIISSFVLLTLGGRKAQLEGAVKYMAMNILASMIFLTGIGILYGLTGSLNMADLSIKVAAVENRNLVNLTAIFFIIGFGIKSAVFPLYFWLPSSYHTPPSAVAAIFGGLLTKVGIYALFRVFTLIFVPDDFIKNLFMVIAVLTIITGALGAVLKTNIRRMFSYLIVCHIGFILGGLSMFTEIALIGAIFYLIHDIMVKTNLFLVSGLLRTISGGTMQMERMGGLYSGYPKITLLSALVLFSLVGFPPLSGFWPKIFLFEASFFEQNYIFTVALILGSFATLYVIARLWIEVFWKPVPVEEESRFGKDFERFTKYGKIALILPIGFLLLFSLYIGFFAEHILILVKQISQQMLDTGPYIKAVLGK